MRPKYRDLYFGRSDSRNEYTTQPEEFRRSFVDLKNIVEDLVAGNKFLVLGPKGTGKSAIAWYIHATDEAGKHLSLVRDASDLPLSDIPRLDTGQPPGAERTVVAWKFVLLCNYLELLLSDNACSLGQDPEVLRVASHLRDYGFMGDAAGRALLKVATTTISIPIPKLGEIYRRESKTELNIFNILPYLEQWACSATSESRHLLILDGLDSIFLNDEKYDESMGALVQAAYSLNQRLREKDSSGGIALLFRNDVFSRIALQLPDSQKMRDDLSIDLDWRILSGAAGRDAPLMGLVNRKAGLAHGIDSIDVLSYFDRDIQVGRRGHAPTWYPTLQYLLNLTRHTPRDLLRLFEEIRKVEESDSFPRRGQKLSRDVIREGVLQYSTKYFVGAIKNEFAGFDVGGTAALGACQHMQRPTFDAEAFRKALKEVQPEDTPDARVLLTALFYAGAIGNFLPRHSDNSYMQFYHRREDTEVHLGGQFSLHEALIHAWSIPRART